MDKDNSRHKVNDSVVEFSLRQLFQQQKDGVADSYDIPIYQRNYAWGSSEIQQLIDDIADYAYKNKQDRAGRYYIGTLVVHQRLNHKYEVVDGQQRLTTLFLMLCHYQNMLDKSQEGKSGLDSLNLQNNAPIFELDPDKLSFDNREKSTETLRIIAKKRGKLEIEQSSISKEYNENKAIIAGYNEIKSLITNKKLSQNGRALTVEEFFDYLLENVVIYRIQLPKNTDLNHYFEVMNSRGEQLEKHEVIKARLLSVLSNQDSQDGELDRKLFAQIWDAVSNMNLYVQYGFKREHRSKIFGEHWSHFIPKDYDSLKRLFKDGDFDEAGNTNKAVVLGAILDNVQDYLPKKAGVVNLDDRPYPLQSVIQFPAFLLHVLKLFTIKEKSNAQDYKNISVPLDDKQLINAFDACFFQSNIDQKERATRIKAFAYFLLKVKFLFDHYVIKREYRDSEERWSLQALYYSDNNQQQYYRQTFQEGGNPSINKQLLMLQSAFHVSMTTQNYKYWLLGTLNILVGASQCADRSSLIDGEVYLSALEDLAERFMLDRYLAKEEKPYEDILFPQQLEQEKTQVTSPLSQDAIADLLTYGNIRNVFVFNYLDYRLWRVVMVEGRELRANEDKVIYDAFTFTFRNSVEHFYPQNPSDPSDNKQQGGFPLHTFGNLCLLSVSRNSQLSNKSPDDKRDKFKGALKEKRVDSLKLYKMLQKLNEKGAWLREEIQAHEDEMLNLLLTPLSNDNKEEIDE